jgi:quercetin dioxygenase-like cupin family protein
MENNEIEKGKPVVCVEITEYVPNAILSKTIIKKLTGNVTVTAVDEGEETAEKTSPFDVFVQIIDGEAKLQLKEKEIKLVRGEGILIPAHSRHNFNADQKFKMMCTIFKSGYEE